VVQLRIGVTVFDEPFYVGFNVGGYELGLIRMRRV